MIMNKVTKFIVLSKCPGDYEMLVEILEKYLATSGSPGVFVNTSKNILKLLELSMAFRDSRKIGSNLWKSWSVCKYFKKYSEALGIN